MSVQFQFVDKDTQELMHGLNIDSKLRAKSPAKGKPIIFYLAKNATGKLALSKLGRIGNVINWTSSLSLSTVAARRVIERYCHRIVRLGVALPVAVEYVRRFIDGGFSSYENASELAQYGNQKVVDLINYSMRVYHNEISLNTKQAGYRFLPASELIDGKYLSCETINRDVKVSLIMGGMGLGKSYASTIFVGKYFSDYDKICPYSRVSLVVEKTISNNQILATECPENYIMKPLDKMAVDDKRISIASKQAYVNLYELKDNKVLRDAVANDPHVTRDIITTIDSLDIVIDDKFPNVNMLYLDDNNELQLKPTASGKTRKMLLILDEIESSAVHFLAGTLKGASEKYNLLRRLIELADKVIVMDAFLSQNTINWITSLLSVPSYEIIECENPHMKDIDVAFFSGDARQGAGLNALSQDCSARAAIEKESRKSINNAIAVYANTASEVMVMGKYLNDIHCHNSKVDSQHSLNICVYTKDVLRVFSRKGKNDIVTDYLLSDFQDTPNQFINQKRIDAFIFSPVMESGVSIHNTPQFGSMYAFAKPSFKNSSAFGLQQALYRFRNTFKWNIVISAFSDNDAESSTTVNSLDGHVDSVLDSLAYNAQLCLSQDSSNQVKKKSQIAIESAMLDSFVMDKLDDIASKYYDFGAAWCDLVKIRGIQAIAVTRFANIIYFNLKRMGIENFHICIDDNEVDTTDIRKKTKEQYLTDLVTAENPSSKDVIDKLKLKRECENLTQDENLMLLKGLLLTEYSVDGVYNKGTEIRDMRDNYDGVITSLDVLTQADTMELFDAYLKKRDKLHNVTSLNRVDEIMASLCVSLEGIGEKQKWKTDSSKLDIVVSKDAKSILATQAIQQLSSGTGLSSQWAIDNNVHNLLDCSESKAIFKLLKMLDSNFGVNGNLITSQRPLINGKRVRIYKVDTTKLNASALSSQALALVSNNTDHLTQRLDNIATNSTS